MSDYKEPGTVIEVHPSDVTVSSEGKVEIVNVHLREAIKAAVNIASEQARARAENGALCNPNFYQCGKAAAQGLESPVQVSIK